MATKAKKKYTYLTKAIQLPDGTRKYIRGKDQKELAGVQAVCDFYGWELYNFLVTGDVLDQAVYDVSGLADANHNMDKLYVAIEIAKRI